MNTSTDSHAATINEETTLRDLVVDSPRTREVLESFGIDYCCGGAHTLAEGAQNAGVRTEDVLAVIEDELATADEAEEDAGSWADASLSDLVTHIESTHHAFMKETLPRVTDLLGRVQHAHGEQHGDMLKTLAATFSGLRTEIEMHLMKEEEVLFVYVRQLEAALETDAEIPPIDRKSVV